MAPLLIGIDLGTSSLKTALFSHAGRLLVMETQEYPLRTPRANWAEQDPQDWLSAAQNTLRRLLRHVPDPQEIAAIGLSGQMHGLVCLSAEGYPLRPAIIWADARSRQQVDHIYQTLGSNQLGRLTCNPVATGFMLPSWLWLAQHEPETARATDYLLLPKDYLRYWLTGRVGAEPSDASSTLLFDPAHHTWSSELLDAFHINPALLPPLGNSAQIAGHITPAAAAATGLRAGTPVVYGASDQAAQAIGNGVVRPGLAACTIGTGGQLFAPLSAANGSGPAYDPLLRLHLFCHAVPGLWHLLAATLSAGLSLRWLRDNILPGSSYHQLAEMASSVPPGAGGLLFLPHLIGERTPYMDPQARGLFAGLALHHNRGHLVRAVMEGVVLELRQGLDLMLSLGVPVERLIASGGATRHPLWLRLQADIFNHPITITTSPEAAALGAALLAGVGVGLYPDIQTACQETIPAHPEPLQPDPIGAARYEEVYTTFRQLYPAARSIISNDLE